MLLEATKPMYFLSSEQLDTGQTLTIPEKCTTVMFQITSTAITQVFNFAGGSQPVYMVGGSFYVFNVNSVRGINILNRVNVHYFKGNS